MTSRRSFKTHKIILDKASNYLLAFLTQNVLEADSVSRFKK